MISELMKSIINNKYMERCNTYPEIMKDVNCRIDALDKRLEMILKYIYTHITAADLAETEFEVYLDYAVQAMFLWQTYERVRNLPEDIFWKYVVNPYAGNEEADICRTTFYHLIFKYFITENLFWNKENAVHKESLKDYFDEMTENEIADAVNFWCASEALTCENSGRTVSAKTVFNTGMGNDEEIASFYIHALRSVGIPAKHVNDKGVQNKVSVYVSNEWIMKTVCQPWADMDTEDDDSSAAKRLTAQKARVQGQCYVKRKHWKNDEREKFFFGDIYTMNMRARLINMMSEKDQFDMKYQVMEEHFSESYLKNQDMDEEFYIKYLLNPRIGNEVLRPWKKMLKNVFTSEERANFRNNPLLICDVINKRFEIITDEELGKVHVSPYASLKLGKVSADSAKILFVAIARVSGIPARICDAGMNAEYWNGEMFCVAL